MANTASGKVAILSIESLSGANSTENNAMNVVGVVDGAVFNQDELVSSLIAVKRYGAYIYELGRQIKDVPTVSYNGETYTFGVYTLNGGSATTYRKGTGAEFMEFMTGIDGPESGGTYAFINTKKITG